MEMKIVEYTEISTKWTTSQEIIRKLEDTNKELTITAHGSGDEQRLRERIAELEVENTNKELTITAHGSGSGDEQRLRERIA